MNVEELKLVLEDFSNESYKTTQLIIDECDKQSIKLVVSYTGDNEILLYVVDKGNYHNIIIDSDNDLWYMFIGIKRKESDVKPIEQPYDIQEIVTKYLSYGV